MWEQLQGGWSDAAPLLVARRSSATTNRSCHPADCSSPPLHSRPSMTTTCLAAAWLHGGSAECPSRQRNIGPRHGNTQVRPSLAAACGDGDNAPLCGAAAAAERAAAVPSRRCLAGTATTAPPCHRRTYLEEVGRGAWNIHACRGELKPWDFRDCRDDLVATICCAPRQMCGANPPLLRSA